MAPKKKTRTEASTSTTYDRSKFTTLNAHNRYKDFILLRQIIQERGMSGHLKELVFSDLITKRGWEQYTEQPKSGIVTVVKEFYANLPDAIDGVVQVRGCKVVYNSHTINAYYGLPDIGEDEYNGVLNEEDLDLDVITRKICDSGPVQWKKESTRSTSFRISLLKDRAKLWMYFVSARMIPSTHYSDVTRDRAILIYCIMKGKSIDVGNLIYKQTLRCAEQKRGGLYYPSLIFELCKSAGVKWDGTEEVVHPLSAIDENMVRRILKGNKPSSSSYVAPSKGKKNIEERLDGIECELACLRRFSEDNAHEIKKLVDYNVRNFEAVGMMLRMSAENAGMDMTNYPSITPFPVDGDDHISDSDGEGEDEGGEASEGDNRDV